MYINEWRKAFKSVKDVYIEVPIPGEVVIVKVMKLDLFNEMKPTFKRISFSEIEVGPGEVWEPYGNGAILRVNSLSELVYG